MNADQFEMRESIDVGAIVFAQSKATFSAAEFAEFLQMGGLFVEDDVADDCLAAMVEQKRLREVGPGVYAAAVSA